MESIHANCPCMETCPLNRALGLIGGKWKMQILCSLHNNGTSRYNALRKSLDGVSNTVLATALKELEQDGLIARQTLSTYSQNMGYSSASSSNYLKILNNLVGILVKYGLIGT